MKFIYMDESGKGFLNSPSQNMFVYGALIVEKNNVSKALTIYKKLFTRAKEAIKKGMREDKELALRPSQERADHIHSVLEKFEIHSVDVFNPKKDSGRRKENPWKYADTVERSIIIEDLLKEIKPMVHKIFMFKIEKQPFNEFVKKIHQPSSETLANHLFMPFMFGTLNDWAEIDESKIALITDTLDAPIREDFIKYLSEGPYDNLWSEPILVESHKNAFTQLIDLITYLFYMDKSGKLDLTEHKRLRKIYRSEIRDMIDVKDLVNFLNFDFENTEEEEEIAKKEEFV